MKPTCSPRCRRPVEHPPVAGLRLLGTAQTFWLDDIISDTGQASIGRTRQRDIRIKDDTVSCMHAHIERERDGSYVIVDDRSKNGIYIRKRGSYSDPRPTHRERLIVGMYIDLGDATLVCVDAYGMSPITARRTSEFWRIGYMIYGTMRAVKAHISRGLRRRKRRKVRGELAAPRKEITA